MGRTYRANDLTDDEQDKLDELIDDEGDLVEDQWLDGSYEE